MVGKRLGNRKPPRKLIRKAARVIADGGTTKAAMMAAGYSETTAEHKPETLKNNEVFQEELVNVRAQMAAAAKKADLTFDLLATEARDGLNSMVPFKDAKGDLVLSNVPDRDVRAKWWDRASVMLGVKKDDDGNTGTTVFNINMINQMVQLVQKSRAERGLPV